jgi:hypothetical protein
MNKTGNFETTDEKVSEAKQKPLHVYEIKIEADVPSILTYRITAESPEKALERALKSQPSGVRPNLARRRNLKASVVEAGTSIIRLVRDLKKSW